MALQLQNVPTLFTSVENAPIEPFSISAAGGAAPYTYSAVGLPTGLAIDLNSGEVSGTPTVSGNFAVQFEAVDADSSLAIQESEFAVLAATAFEAEQEPSPDVPVTPIDPEIPISQDVIQTPRQQFFVVGQPIAPFGLYVPPASGFVSPMTYSASWLPNGLSINSSTGQITGTPTVSVGDQDIFLYVTDANGVKFKSVVNLMIVSAANAADASQQAQQSGMQLQIQRPGCLGVSGQIPVQNPGEAVLNAQAAYTAAGYSSGGAGGNGSAPSIVQSVAATHDTTASFTFGEAPTEGNLLIAIVSHWSQSTTAPGWTLVGFMTASADYVSIFARIAGANEPELQDCASGVNSCGIAAFEIAGSSGSVPGFFTAMTDQTGTTLTISQGAAAGCLVLGAFTTTSNDGLPTLSGSAEAGPTISTASGSGSGYGRSVAAFSQSFTQSGGLTETATYAVSEDANAITVIVS